MKTVKIKIGGFFFDESTTRAGDVVDLPDKVADNWCETGIAEPVEGEAADDDEKKPETNETTTTEGKKKTPRRSKKASETSDDAPTETR